ncbi:MAG: hypothetical protein ABI318_03265 [Chthoniobacteraceae bacterium]
MLRERINVRRRDVLVAVKADIRKAEIVGKDDDDIRPALFLCGSDGGKCEYGEEEQEKFHDVVKI